MLLITNGRQQKLKFEPKPATGPEFESREKESTQLNGERIQNNHNYYFIFNIPTVVMLEGESLVNSRRNEIFMQNRVSGDYLSVKSIYALLRRNELASSFRTPNNMFTASFCRILL
ncbi:hypothetical protein SUGI_0771510 [Cryptomeria japonica]|nr:hypothetical protein SUGI_0771510 [Cryptomeria japonica]